jgi:hypothetical protein
VPAVDSAALSRLTGRAVVGDLQLQLVAAVADLDAGVNRAGVLERVGQRLLDDAIHRHVHAGSQRGGIALGDELDIQPAPARLLEQRAEALDPGLWRERHVAVGPAQRAERPAHLAECRAARALDRLERLARALGIAVEYAPRALGLHDHEPDVVRDDVVELACDAGALLRHGVELALALLALESR